MSDLEKDFQEVCNAINLKIKAAAQLLAEAGDIAKENGLNSINALEELNSRRLNEFQTNVLEGININPLFDALDNAGWNTSSIGC